MFATLQKNYYVRRLLILAVIYFGIEFAENIITGIVEWKNLDISILNLCKMAWTTVSETAITFVYFMLPYLAFLMILPQQMHKGKLDRICSSVFLFLFIGVSIFEDVAEGFFWNEFSASFNFIAVDYLIYTKEVIGNINQSYPMVSIISGIVVVTILIFWFARRKLIPNSLDAPRFPARAACFLGAAAFCIAGYLCIDINDAENTQNQYNNEIAKDGFYSLFSAFLKNELSYDKFYLTSDKNEAARFLRQEMKRDGITFKNEAGDDITRTVTPDEQEIRANVIVVIMESMGSEFLNENRKDGANLTPCLTALGAQGLFFPHTYATGTRSVRGLEAVSISLPPLPGMSVVRRQGNENLQTIGSLFTDKGYKTKWIYGGYGYFDNMNNFYESNGFEVVDRTKMDKSEITHTTVWGVCDEDLFNRVIRECDKTYENNEPFMNVVFTTSNHRPYTYPDGKINIPSKTGRSGAVKYADYAVGEFISKAKTRPWFDNTVFVFVADHGAGSAGKKELNPETHLIPLIIYSPKYIKPERHDHMISQIDTLPTLLGVLNFKYEASFYGQDARRRDYKPRAFICNYQNIGYLKGDDMVVMRPVKNTSFYKGNDKLKSPDAERTEELQEAIYYYQHASDWRRHLKNEKETEQ